MARTAASPQFSSPVFGRKSRRPRPHAVITNAKHGRSNDMSNRQRNYIIAMSIRVVCFLSMAVAPGMWRWGLLAAAALLPGIAVIAANAVDRRGERTQHIPAGEPEYHLALPKESTEVVTGHVVDSQDH